MSLSTGHPCPCYSVVQPDIQSQTSFVMPLPDKAASSAQPTLELTPVQPTSSWPNAINPFKTLRRIGLVISGAVILGIVLPGSVGILTENYYPAQVEKHLPPEQATQLAQFKARQAQANQEIARIDTILMQASQHQDRWQHLQARIPTNKRATASYPAPSGPSTD
jgi:hypothetical protein